MIYRRWNSRLSAIINLADIYFSTKPSRFHLKDGDVAAINAMRRRHTDIPIGPTVPVARIQHIAAPAADGYQIPLSVYTPEDVPDNCPIVIYIHGGGFVVGNAEYYEPITTYMANATKSIVVSIDYRKAPENKFPCGVHDCLSAVRWIHQNASALGGDKHRMAVLGDSAGGNLAIIVSIELWDLVTMAVPIYPVISFGMFSESKLRNANAPILKALSVEWFNLRYFRSVADLFDPMANPLVRPPEELSRVPYTHVITAEFDVLLDEGAEYARRLREVSRNRVTYTHYENTVHGFFGAELLTHGQAALKDVCDLMNGHFDMKHQY